MTQPLTRSQHLLRGRKIADMSIAQLHEWIDACNKMEAWVKDSKSRRSWTKSRAEAEAALEARSAKNQISD